MVEHNVLCVVDLLSVYTRKLLDMAALQRNPRAPAHTSGQGQEQYLAWDRMSTSMKTAGKLAVTSLFDQNEIKVVAAVLKLLQTLTSSTTNIHKNSFSLENEAEKKLLTKFDAPSPPKVPKNNVSATGTKPNHFHSKRFCTLCKKQPHRSMAEKSPRFQKSLTKFKRQNVSAGHEDSSQCNHKESELEEEQQQLENNFKLALQQKISEQQRQVRAAMFEAGVIESMSPWLMSCESEHQLLVLAVLANIIEPLEETTTVSGPDETHSPKLRRR